ncbi:MAG: hypothetical protein NVS2B7_19440 [Herpetosiphon sp.]
MDLAQRRALKARLVRTWGAFFERHGNFTAPQLATVPLVLDGQNVMLCAPTASGKTSAVMAPLIERYVPAGRAPHGPVILYLTPTRALAADLQARLRHPLQTLGVTLGVQTGDQHGFRPSRPSIVLITTPESLDSLLTSQARLFIHLRAIVIDELHVLHGMPRGDQLRVLLQRIRRIREYAVAQATIAQPDLQYCAMSATLAAPANVAALYFPAAQVVQIPGGRRIEAEHVDLAQDAQHGLVDFLQTLRARGWRKVLAFCNTRAEVEGYAAAVRSASPFGAAVYVHYSNIVAQRRREIEQAFAADAAALCFASSTLELGIDIGDIDLVMLFGPPANRASLAQRIGRGNRRQALTRVVCFARTPLERLMFDALLNAAQAGTLDVVPSDAHGAHFRPAVAVQQIFSLIKQNPTGAIRLPELAGLFAGCLTAADLQTIVGELQVRNFLQPGRPGEWRPGRRLNELLDEQATAEPSFSIYSNVQQHASRQVELRDQQTQRVVARVDEQWFDREVLTLEGRPISVEWYDGAALWVSSYRGQDAAQKLRFRSSRQLLGYELARSLPAALGLASGVAPALAAPSGWWWFHWLGDVYGRVVLDLLRYHVAALPTAENGICILLPDPLVTPPPWTAGEVERYLHDNYRQLEPLLDLGPFQHLVPSALRRRAVIEQFDVPRFLAAVAELRPCLAPDDLADDLLALVGDAAEADADQAATDDAAD